MSMFSLRSFSGRLSQCGICLFSAEPFRQKGHSVARMEQSRFRNIAHFGHSDVRRWGANEYILHKYIILVTDIKMFRDLRNRKPLLASDDKPASLNRVRTKNSEENNEFRSSTRSLLKLYIYTYRRQT
jgi:hypothetical protein